MKKTKRIVSVLMAVAMLLTTVSSGLSAFASVSVTNSPVTVSIVVPELIYLTPGATSFQYYIAGAANGTTPSTTQDSLGRINFSCSQTATSISIAASGANSISFSPSTASNTSTLSTTITSGAKSDSGLITWTFTYVVNGVTYVSYAGTYVYKPYLGQVGAQHTYKYNTSVGKEPNLGAYAFLVGIHSATGGSYDCYYTGTSGYAQSPLVSGWGDANVPTSDSGTEHHIDSTYYPSNSSGTGGVASYGRTRTDNKTVTAGSTGVYGTLTIDSSRYASSSNMNLIPNFSGGWMVHHSKSSSDTHKLNTFSTTTAGLSLNIASDVNYTNEKNGQAFGGYKPTGAVPSSSTRYDMQAHFRFERSSSSCVNLKLEFALQLNLVDKFTLRTVINNAISACHQQADYTSASWNAYHAALISAITTLGNPTLDESAVSAAVSSLNSAVAGLVKNQYTYTVYHKLPAVNGFQYTYGGASYTAVDGYVTVAETGSFNSNYNVTVSANTDFSGYSYVPTTGNPSSVTYSYRRSNLVHTFTYTALTSTLYFANESIHSGFVTNYDASMTVTYAQPYGTFKTPSMEGYKFNGWYSGGVRILGTTVCTMISSSLTLTSNWTCYFAGGHGTANDPFLVSSLAHLDNIDDTTVITNNAGMYFKQTASFEYTLAYAAVRNFAGNYNGQNFTIIMPSSVTVAENTYANIFGEVSNASIYNLNITLNGKMQATSYTLDNYAGFVGKLNQSSLSDIQIIFGGTLNVGTAAGKGYAGIMAGYVSGSSSIANSSVTLNGGTITNAGNSSLQNAFIGAVASGATLTKTNTWTLINTTPAGYTGALSNNIMRVRENGTVSLSINEGTGIFTFTAVPSDGWTTQFRTASDTLVSSNATYSPETSMNGAEYYACFVKGVTVAAGAGGNVAGAGTYNIRQGEQITGLSATPSTGHHFVNWSNTTNGTLSSTTSPQTTFTMGTTSGMITGNFAINTYTLAYNANAGSDQVTVPAPAVYSYNQSVTIASAPVRPGYEFVKWNSAIDGSGTTYNVQGIYTNITTEHGATVTLHAIWNKLKYDVTFHTVGGTTVENHTGIDYGTVITFPVTTKIGYLFDMWYESPTYTGGNSYPAGGQKTIYANLTVYAKWNPISYTITFNATGATNIPNVMNVQYSETPLFSLPSGIPVKAGWTFVSWNTAQDGNGTSYLPGAEITTNLRNTQGANVNLYAIWQAASFTVTWDICGGALNGIPSNIETTVVFNSKYVVPSGTFFKSGHTFAGWFTAQEGGTQITNNTTVTITDNITYYAHWDYATYTIKFDANGGFLPDYADPDSMNDILCTYGTEYVLSFNAFEKNGYNFNGWALTAGGDVVFIDGETVSNLTGTVNGVVTLYASWLARTYSISYNKNNGNGSMTPSSIKMDATITLKANTFTRTGYRFYGWALSAADATDMIVAYADVASFSLTTASNVTLYAVWSRNTTVTWFLEGGTYNGATANPTTNVYYGDKYVLPTGELLRTGGVFDGWYDRPQSQPGAILITNGTTLLTNSDSSVYAHWRLTDVKYYVKHFQQNIDGSYPATPERTLEFTESIGATASASPLPESTSGYAGFAYDYTAYQDSSMPQEAIGSSAVVVQDGSLVFKVYYSRNSYSISYNGNGATSGSMQPQTFKSGEQKALSDNAFAKTSYKFIGWATTQAQALNGIVTYVDKFEYTMGTANITLYAVWQLNTYKITFSAGDGKMLIDGQELSQYVLSAAFGADITGQIPPNPTREGCSFVSWQRDGVNYTIPDTMPNEDITVIALWSLNTYYITFEPNGGTGTMSNQGIVFGQQAKLNSNAFTRVGYTFGYWSVGENNYANGAMYGMTLAGDVVLTANWIPNAYTVGFNANSGTGTAPANVSATYDTPFELPANTFSKSGFSFVGWAVTPEAPAAYADEATVEDNLATGAPGNTFVTLYAVWGINNYTITYVANGATSGTVPSSVPAAYNQQITLADGDGLVIETSTESRSFLGWTTVEDGVVVLHEVGSNFIVPANDVVFYAVWSADYFALNLAVNTVNGYQEDGWLAASPITDPLYALGGDIADELDSDGIYPWGFFNTAPITAACLAAQQSGSKNLPQSRQAEVDALTYAIVSAVDNVELLLADKDKEINCEHYDESFFVEDLGEHYPPCSSNMKHSFNSIIATCQSIIGMAPASRIYTAASVANLNSHIFGEGTGIYNTAVSAKVKLPAQALLLDYYTGLIAEAYHTMLVLKPADYSSIDYLLNDYLPSIDGIAYANITSYYTADSCSNLVAVVEGIDYDLKIVSQARIDDEFYPAVEEAINILVPLAANYTSIFNIIINSIPYGTAGYSYPAADAQNINYTLWMNWAAANSGGISDVLDTAYLSPRYTPASLQAVYDILDCVDWTLYRFAQNTIDGTSNDQSYAALLTAAINALAQRTYSVTFMQNDGTEDVFNTLTVNYAQTVPNPGTPLREGFEFIEWRTSDGTPVNYTTPVLANVILYAAWHQDTVEEPVLIVPDNSEATTVIDEGNNFIYGLKVGISEAELISIFLGVEGNGHIVISTSTGSIGTGTTVTLISDNTGLPIAAYTIIIFGDTNGDGIISQVDMINLNAAVSGSSSSALSDAALFAVDLNGDGFTSLSDVAQLKSVIARSASINQSTGRVS